jgi:hypothetical protein
MPVSRRETYLDHGRVTIECPRLMTDVELADVHEAFIAEVRARPPKEPVQPRDERPSSALPAFRAPKRKPR